MLLGELFGRAGISCPEYAENIEIRNIVTDSRRATKDSLFICIKGLVRDGHEYIENALENGASVIVAETVRDACVGGAAAFIMLDNTRKVASLLYNAFYGEPTKKLKIIGITGTNGKTSTSTLLYEIFKAAGLSVGLLGTVCRITADGRALSPQRRSELSDMTTPDPEELYAYFAEMVRDRVEYVIMEVSSHALALDKVAAINFDTAVFTNLTRDHLDFHQTMEEYFRAKRKLFEISRQGLINIGGEYGKRLTLECPCPFFTCSATYGDFCALDVKMQGLDGISYTHKGPYGELDVTSPMCGEFAVENTLMAISIARMYRIAPEVIQGTVAHFCGARGRMERVELDTDELTVIIDYAHTPDALERLLLNVRPLVSDRGRVCLVFGCGGERDRGKRKLMGAVASRLADRVIVTADNSRGEDLQQIISDILKGIDKEKCYSVIPDRERAIHEALAMSCRGDVIVMAGKGHEKYEICAEGKRPFDEIKIVKEAFAERQRHK